MSTNEVLPARWAERVRRLRIGVAPRDANGRLGPIAGIGLHLEDVPVPWPLPRQDPQLDPGIGLPGVAQSPSGRFAVCFGEPPDAALSTVTVRIVDRHRRFVPRRLAIPVPGLQTVVDAEKDHAADPALPLSRRAFRPVLFPGAAYGVAAGATVVRGEARWSDDGEPVAWPRVVARVAQVITITDDDGVETTAQPVLGRAHGDDRGEFLLFVGALPFGFGLPAGQTLDVEVRVNARPRPAANAPADSPTQSRDDPLWDLPVENVGTLDDNGGVALGTSTPGGFTATVTQVVTVRRGTSTRPSVRFTVPTL